MEVLSPPRTTKRVTDGKRWDGNKQFKQNVKPEMQRKTFFFIHAIRTNIKKDVIWNKDERNEDKHDRCNVKQRINFQSYNFH